MADSFMIRFVLHGKPCYANVYVYNTIPIEYHVHLVNAHLYPGVPEEIVIVDGHEGLKPRELSAAISAEVKHIIQEIEQHRDARRN